MCGICGKISLSDRPVEADLLSRMCQSISYRGPDDAGISIHRWSCGMSGSPIHGGLGHRRLSVIDLTPAGHQPMSNEDGTVVITFNGEIYNFKALKSELIRKGHVFRSNTDTEVILHLYEEEGTNAVRRLNGMFAYALWDENKSRLWICRDRIGIKPLVYYWNGKQFLFASEIKAILCDPIISKKMDRDALTLYLSFNYIPAPYTIFEDIHKLEPGHFLVLENGKLKIERYWDISPNDDSPISPMPAIHRQETYQKLLFQTINEAVQSQMVADVSLGAFLSGGLDSSIIVALMATHAKDPIKTFSIGFKADELYDETHYARKVAKHYKTDHHEFKLTYKELLDVFPEVLSMFDEPFADSSAVATYIVSRETRKYVTVALSGDGGDELFAGYRSYLGEYFYSYYRMIPAFIRKRFFEELMLKLPDSRSTKVLEYNRRLKKFIRATRGTFPQRLLSLKEIFPKDLRRDIFLKSDVTPAEHETDLPLKWIREGLACFPNDRINAVLCADVKKSLPGDMLNKVDWMSMKNSLEVRVPFLDHRVVELAFRMPGAVKIRKGKTKYIIRETFKNILPRCLHNRPKAGFEVPISRWLKTDLKFLLDQYLDKKKITRQELFNYPVIERLIGQQMSGKTDTSWMLWNLIVFQYWHEQYMQ